MPGSKNVRTKTMIQWPCPDPRTQQCTAMDVPGSEDTMIYKTQHSNIDKAAMLGFKDDETRNEDTTIHNNQILDSQQYPDPTATGWIQ